MISQNWLGKTIGGRYQIEALLGQGGMSAVYRAIDPNLRRTVAIKLIHPHLSADPNFVGRFKEEAAAVARLRHPNIVQVHDFNMDGDTYYMVMEYLVGETLQARLKRLNENGRYLSYSDAVNICLQVCDAAGYAHNHELIHRDIKPANIMIDVNGQAILTDFGIVKIVGGEYHTATGATIGTAMYMSPEQIRGERADDRSDIYSLGVTLYEMLSGRPPYQNESAVTLMMMVLNDPLPNLREIRADIPDELLQVISRALAKEKTERFQSMVEMAAALMEAKEKINPVSAGSTVMDSNLVGSSLPVSLATKEPHAVENKYNNSSQTPSRSTQQDIGPPKQIGRQRFSIFGINGWVVLVIILIVGGLASFGLYSLTPVLGILHPPTATQASTIAPLPTETLAPTNTALLTDTLTPTDTPLPTNTLTPTFTAVPSIATPVVLFFDNFSNPTSGWDITHDPTYSTDYYQGWYRIVVTDTNTQVWTNPGLNLSDVAIDVDTYKSGGVDDNKFGVICRYQNVDNFYYFLISSDGYYGISRKVNGTKQILGADTLLSSPTINHGTAVNHIRALCIGSTFTLFVNGQFVESQTDTSFTSGDVGLTAGTYDTGIVDILFDNFMVSQP